MKKRFVVVSYDISDDVRRNQIFKCLKKYGQHVQYSVFECELIEKDYVRMRHELERVINRDEGDHLRFYFLCSSCRERVKRMGGPKPWKDEDGFVI